MTQIDRILRHIREFGSITPAEAMSEYGIYRLAARISDLKAAGYAIKTETVKDRNRFGEPTRYARYSLTEEAHHEEAHQ